MRYLILATLLGKAPFVFAQNPGQHVQVDVGVVSVSIVGDTTNIAYQVNNSVTSAEPLWTFNVDSPGGVLGVTASPAPAQWLTGTNFRGRPMAGWMFFGDIGPGSTTPTLRFEAVGLPGIVTYWAGGYFPLPAALEEVVTDSTVLPDPFVTRMITGQSIGVEPWPANRSAQVLLARLRTLTQTSCSAPLTWITDVSLCGQLIIDLDQAEVYLSNGQVPQAREALLSYQAGISSGSSVGTVKNPAYWLLKSNAEIVAAIL